MHFLVVMLIPEGLAPPSKEVAYETYCVSYRDIRLGLSHCVADVKYEGVEAHGHEQMFRFS